MFAIAYKYEAGEYKGTYGYYGAWDNQCLTFVRKGKPGIKKYADSFDAVAIAERLMQVFPYMKLKVIRFEK